MSGSRWTDGSVLKMAMGLALLGFTTSPLRAQGAENSLWRGFEAAFGGGFASHNNSQSYLGVDVRDIRDEQISALKLKESRGAEIIRVDHDGPAGKAGLCVHDVVLQLNGQAIEGEEQLRRMLSETPVGHSVTLIISRDGQQQTITTKMANRSDVERQAWEQHFTVPEPDSVETQDGVTGKVSTPQAPQGNAAAAPAGSGFLAGSTAAAPGKTHSFIGSLISGSSYTGAMVETMGQQLAEFFGVQEGGVLVHSVDANSPAAVAGLRAGDVVVRANALAMTNTSVWMKVMHENKGKPVPVVVLRDKKEQTLSLTPDAKRRSSIEQGKQPATASPAALAMVGFSLR